MPYQPKSPEIQMLIKLLERVKILDLKVRASLATVRSLLPAMDEDPEIRQMVAEIFDYIKAEWRK